jgi:hypothetical protein
MKRMARTVTHEMRWNVGRYRDGFDPSLGHCAFHRTAQSAERWPRVRPPPTNWPPDNNGPNIERGQRTFTVDIPRGHKDVAKSSRRNVADSLAGWLRISHPHAPLYKGTASDWHGGPVSSRYNFRSNRASHSTGTRSKADMSAISLACA